MSRGRLSLLIGAAVIALLGVRASSAARDELNLAVEAERVGDLEGAVIYHRRAASWLVPFASAPEVARSSLRRIAAQAASDQNLGLELSATRALWSSLQARRVLSTWDEGRPALAQRLAELSIRSAPPALGDGRSRERRIAALKAELLAATRPQPFGMLCAVLGFLCWASAVFLLPVRGLDADHRPTAAARSLGTAFVIGFGLFVLGLALA